MYAVHNEGGTEQLVQKNAGLKAGKKVDVRLISTVLREMKTKINCTL